jgi:protein-disulfide isomerase
LDTEPQLIDRYIATGKVRLVYRHLAQIGEGSELLAEYSECAADQGRFWELRHALYARTSQLYNNLRDGATAAAAEVGLDTTALNACVDNHTHQAMVQADYAASIKEGIRSRPVFLIGAQTVIGAQRFSAFQQAIDTALAGR